MHDEEIDKALPGGHKYCPRCRRPLQEFEIDALLDFISTYNANFKPVAFELTKGEVTRFSDMDHYEPVK